MTQHNDQSNRMTFQNLNFPASLLLLAIVLCILVIVFMAFIKTKGKPKIVQPNAVDLNQNIEPSLILSIDELLRL